MIQKIFFFIFLFSALQSSEEPNLLSTAHSYYEKGLHANTLLERKEAFNQALAAYLEIEQETNDPSAKLYEIIANTFYLLEAYPWSILYHYKALQLEPQNISIQKHLSLAQTKLGLPINTEPKLLDFALKQKLQMLFYLILAALITASFLIWVPTKFLKVTFYIFLVIPTLLLGSILYSFYLSPIEGVLITPTALYSQPELNQPQLNETPLVKGLKIQILGSVKNGHWLKVSNSNGVIGFIPADSIRII